jgi:predicted AAA+ superfamily ATPase
LDRSFYQEQIKKQFKVHPCCALLGPRQVGKTTIAKQYSSLLPNIEYFDLENPLDLASLDNAMLTLSKFENQLIIIDEIQLRPELFPILRVLVDEHEKKRRFLILGSASRDLIRQSSETLAGRIGYIEVTPFSKEEVHNRDRLWLRGGFPRSYLAEDSESSTLWRQEYIRTFLERDIPALGFQIPPRQLHRFWLMLAHYHGQILNASEIGRALECSDHTVRRYLDLLEGTFMVRVLRPWFENLKKRQVKSPKLYVRDSGILNTLIGIKENSELVRTPKLGALWEGFALEEIVKETGARSDECYFWATQSGAELDLLIVKDGKKIGYEFKYTEQPKVSPSMKNAIEDLSLDHLYIIYPGAKTFALTESITARHLG